MANYFDKYDIAEPAPAAGNYFDKYDPGAPTAEPRSLFKEVPIQAYAGATIDLPKQFGQALQWMSSPGEKTHEWGKEIQDWATTREANEPGLAPQVEGRGLAGRALSTGARALAPSTAVMVPAAIGAAVAPAVGATALAGAAAGGAAGAFGLFGASQAQDTYDKLRKAGVDEAAAREAGWINLMIEGGGETAGTIAGLKLFGLAGKALTKGMSPVAGAIAGATDTAVVKPFLAQLPKTLATEMGTEFGQNFGEAWVENKYGAPSEPGQGPLQQGIQGAEAALGMTILLAPFGLSGFAARAKQNERRALALEDPTTPVLERLAAATVVFNEINAVDKDAAKAWSQNSTLAIVTDSPIILDETTAQPGEFAGKTPYEIQGELARRRAPSIEQSAAEEEAITAAGARAIDAAQDIDQIARAAVDATSQPIGPSATGLIGSTAFTSEQERELIMGGRNAQGEDQIAQAEQEAADLAGMPTRAPWTAAPDTETGKTAMQLAFEQADAKRTAEISGLINSPIEGAQNAIQEQNADEGGILGSAGRGNAVEGQGVGSGNAQPQAAAGTGQVQGAPQGQGVDQQPGVAGVVIPETPEQAKLLTDDHLAAARNLTRSDAARAIIDAEIVRRGTSRGENGEINSLQVRPSEAGGAAGLPGVPRQGNAGIQGANGVVAAPAQENGVSLLRPRLPETGQADAGAVPMRQPGQPNAPSGLQPAAAGGVDVSGVPSGVTPQSSVAPSFPEKQKGPVLQNRDRSSAASVTQMAAIAASPDPVRLSFSRDFLSGAPTIIPDGATIPPANMGAKERIVTAAGREIPVQYAVVEAKTLLPSHGVDGIPNQGYDTGLAGRLRVVAGNGRAAGLQGAYRKGTTLRYIDGILADARLHGVPAKTIKGMNQPVLVRVMADADVTQNLGDETNIAAGAELSPAEKAGNDARRIDLTGLEFGEDGEVTPEAVRQFVTGMPETERAGLIDQNGQPTRQAYDRLTNAVFIDAYVDPGLVALQSQATDTEARTVMAAMVRAAPAMARLKEAGDLDIRPIVVEAAKAVVNAKRAGVSVTKFAAQADITMPQESRVVLQFFAENIRSAARIGEGLARAATTAAEQAGLPAVDMFGNVPRMGRAQVLEKLYDTEGQKNLGDQARAGAAGQYAGGQTVDRQGQAGGGATPGVGQAGAEQARRAYNQNQQGFDLTADRANANAARPDLALTPISPAEQRTEAEAADKAKAEAEAEAKRQEEADRQKKIDAEVKARNEIGAASFELTASVAGDKKAQKAASDKAALDQLAGQGGLFQQSPVYQAVTALQGAVADLAKAIAPGAENGPPNTLSAEQRKGRDQGEATPQLDLFAETDVSRQENPQPAILVEPAQRGILRVGFDKIDTAEKAAHTFAALRKAPREYFQMLLTDKSDKPLAVFDLFAGTITQTSVYPREVLTAAYATPGAAKLWFAHNHPSGVAEPSSADINLTKSLAQGLGLDLGIEFQSHIIIAGNKAVAFGEDGRMRKLDIPPASRKYEIPIMERVIKRQSFAAREGLSSPAQARAYIEKNKITEPGLILMDAQHRVLVFWPMARRDMANLRTKDSGTGFGGLARLISKINPGAAFVVDPTADNTTVSAAASNLKAALGLMDVQLLDAFSKDSNGVLVSAQERGSLASPMTFFSRKEGAAYPPGGTRLSVLHNLGTENLKFADKLGGLPVPSLGIVKDGMGISGMGDVTLIGRKDLGNPATEPIHDADVYSPTFPRPEYDKVRSATAQAVLDEIKPFANRFDDYNAIQSTWDDAVNTPNPDKIIQSWLNGNAAKAMYLSGQGVVVEPVMRNKSVEFPWVKYMDKETWRELDREIDDAPPGERTSGPAARKLVDLIRSAIDKYLTTDKEGKGILRVISRRAEAKQTPSTKADMDAARKSAAGYWGAGGEWINQLGGEIPFSMIYKIAKSYDNLGQQEVDRGETEKTLNAELKGKEAEFKQWVDDKVMGMFGRPFLRIRGKKEPYTLSNIVEAMTGRVRGQEQSMTFGEGKARAVASKKFRDLEQMRKAAGAIADESEIKESRDTAKKLMEDWRNSVTGYYGEPSSGRNEFGRTWDALDASMKAMARWARGAKTEENMRRALANEGFRTGEMSAYHFENGVEAGMAWLKAPVPYFEAKPQRAVAISEFAGAVIPESADAATRAVLDKHGVPYRTYIGRENQQKVTDQFRRELAAKGEDVLFSQPWYYSALARGIEVSTMKAAPVAGWKSYIQGLVNKGTVKQAEIEATGINDWLATQEGRVTKEKMQSFFDGLGLTSSNTPSALLLGHDAAAAKGVSDAGSVGAKILSDATNSDAFREHGFGGLDVPTQHSVLEAMFAAAQNPHVLNAIVASIPVGVVDILRSQQLTPEMFFHDHAMLADALFRNRIVDVDISASAVSDLVQSFALSAAENTTTGRDHRLTPIDLGAALDTMEGRHGVTPQSSVVTGAGGAETLSAPNTVRPVGENINTRQTGMTPALIKTQLAQAIEKLTIPTVVHADVEAARQATGVAIPDTARAMYHADQVHLFAGSLDTALEAETAFWHEVEHAGLSHLYGTGSREYDRALTKLASQNRNIRMNAAQWRGRYGDEALARAKEYGMADDMAKRYVVLQSYDEALADLSGTNAKISGLKQFLAVVQKFLRSIGLTNLADAMEGKTDAEALVLIAKARKSVMKDGAHITTGELAPAFQTGTLAPSAGDWRDAPLDDTQYITRDEYYKALNPYVKDGAVIANSRLVPNDNAFPPLGSWRIDTMKLGYGREIEKLVELPIDKLVLGELDSKGRLDPVKAGDEVRYAEWIKAGKRPPPIEVVQTEEGRLSVTDGHRRALAAKLAGAKTVEAWVNFAVPVPDGSRYNRDPNGKQIRTGMTYEMLIGEIHNPYLDRLQFSRKDQTETPEFKAWFGDSKVVDAEGKPLVVYHGTTKDFTQFDTNRPRAVAANPAWSGDVGSWFAAQSKYPGNYDEGNAEAQAAIYTEYNGRSAAPIPEWPGASLGYKENAAVYPVYLSIKNPLEFEGWEDFDDYSRENFNKKTGAEFKAGIEKLGHDGMVIRNSMTDGDVDRDDWVAFHPTQIKSAIGNRGTFDATNPDIRFSQPAARLFTAVSQSPKTGAFIIKSLMSSPASLGVFNAFNSQYHKAEMLARKGIPGFKAVFNEMQAFLNDINALAVRAEQQAPAIFRELTGMSPKAAWSYFKGAAKESDIAAIGPWLNHGTLYGKGSPLDGRVWTDDQLRGKFEGIGTKNPGLKPLTEQQIELYHQARAAIDQSLEDNAKALMFRHVNRYGIVFDKDMSLADVAEIVRQQLDDQIEAAKERAGALQEQIDNPETEFGDEDQRDAHARLQREIEKSEKLIADLRILRGDDAEEVARKEANNAKVIPGGEFTKEEIDYGVIGGIERKANALIEHGYMPLMRFGNRTVTARDSEGKVQFFYTTDGKPLVPGSANLEMNQVAEAVRALHPDWQVSTGIKAERAWQMYQGMSMEALENFLEFLDPETKAALERDATIQEYLTSAVNNRSVLKRLIHREGTPGFAKDVPRVLSSFITSSSRNSSGLYHLGEAKRLVEEIPDRHGDVKDEAADLVKYVTEPGEEAAKLRGFLFFNFLGGSIAAAAVNMTQTVMMCVDDETEALTRNGWKRHTDLVVGEDILTYDIGTDTCRWGALKDINAFAHNGPMFTMESGQISSRTTDGHRWPVVDKSSGKRYTVTNGIEMPKGNGRGTKAHKRLCSLHSIPTGRAVDNLPGDSHFSDAFVALCGWIATEGTLTKDSRKYRPNTYGKITSIEITQSPKTNRAKVDAIRALLVVDGIKFKERIDPTSGAIRFRLSNADARRFFPHLSASKSPAPEFVASLPARQLRLLIKAMIDGDGTRPRGTPQAQFFNTDKALIDVFQMAVTLSGGSCRVMGPFPNGVRSTKPIYRVRVSHGRFATSASVVRSAKAPTHYDGTVWCPTVDTGFWVARRAGRTYCTGNTAPWLAQHAGAADLVSALGKAAKLATGDPAKMSDAKGLALQKAERTGITAPQQIYHLTATAANNPFSSNRGFRSFMTIWGSLFSTVEVFNRRVAFLAAYDIGAANGLAGKELYDVAVDAVVETQLVYNKGNKPNLGRGAVGSTVMTFKQYSIGYLELLRRLPPKQQLLMMGILALVAGGEGLPFAEDIEDLIDTLGQWLGFSTNTGKWTGKVIKDTLGPEYVRPILKGLGGMLPLDLHSRMGMQNLLPGTAFFKPSEIDKTRDVADAVGPLGGVLKSLSDSLQLLARGKWDSAAVGVAPKAIRDAYNGFHMAATGESQDTKGRLAMKDVTAGEAFGKLIGFNPQRAAVEGETKRELMLDRNLRTVRMDEITTDIADAVLRSDAQARRDALEKLRQWNIDNPGMRIDKRQVMRSVQERVRAAKMTSEQRFIKSVPKPMKQEAREALK